MLFIHFLDDWPECLNVLLNEICISVLMRMQMFDSVVKLLFFLGIYGE